MGTSAARGLTNMAVGKNKRLTKGKKGSKKKIIDPFASKDWYDIKAPSVFTNPICGKTLASRTKGTKLSSDALKGRVCEVSLGDLKQNEDDAYRKIRLRIEDVQGKQVLCNFWGMDFTTDKLRSLVRKWQSLIESNVDVKTTDGYVLRCFCIGFTKRRQFQIRKTSYAQSAQIRAIRKKMTDIMTKEVSSVELIKAVEKFIPEYIGRTSRRPARASTLSRTSTSARLRSSRHPSSMQPSLLRSTLETPVLRPVLRSHVTLRQRPQ